MAHSVRLSAPDGQGPDLWGQEREVSCKSQSQWDALFTAHIFKPGQSIVSRQMEYNAGEFQTTLLHFLTYAICIFGDVVVVQVTIGTFQLC